MLKRTGSMLCYPMDEARYNKWDSGLVITQPKLDGERCRIIQEGSKVKLLSSTEQVILSVPHINEYFEDLIEEGYSIPELDGELYCHGMSFDEISSIVGRTVNLHPDFWKMQFHVFDIADDGKLSQFDRLMKLKNFTLSLKLTDYSHNVLVKVPVSHATSFTEVYGNYEAFLSDGYEGIIIRHPGNFYLRHRSTFVMKFKPKKDDFYRVIGVKEEISKDGIPKGRLGAIICEGSTGDLFSVGSGLTDAQREEYWHKDITNWLVHVSYQNINSKTQVPRFPVFMELINPNDPIK